MRVSWSRSSGAGRILAPLLALVALPASVAAHGVVALGDERPIAEGTLNRGTAPQVAHTADGRFLAVWSGNDRSSGGVLGRLLDAEGGSLGPVLVLNEYTLNEQREPALATSPDGGAVVVWTTQGPSSPYESAVRARRIAPDGSPLGPELDITDLADGDAFAPRSSVAFRDDGSFAIAWTREHPQARGFTPYSAHYRRYDADGRPLGAPVTVADVGGGDFAASIRVDGGGFRVLWQRDSGPGGVPVREILARRYDGSGVPLTDATVLTDPLGGSVYRAEQAVAAAGHALTVLQRGGTGVRARWTDASGTPVGPELPIAPDAGYPDVVVAPSGDFVVLWKSFDDRELHGRHYGADGTRRGDDFQVNTYTTGGQDLPRAAMAGDGSFLVVWHRQEDVGLPVLLSERCFALPPPCSGGDGDRDGVPDGCDNCPALANPAQSDGDLDGLGDGCDPVTYRHRCPERRRPLDGAWESAADPGVRFTLDNRGEHLDLSLVPGAPPLARAAWLDAGRFRFVWHDGVTWTGVAAETSFELFASLRCTVGSGNRFRRASTRADDARDERIRDDVEPICPFDGDAVNGRYTLTLFGGAVRLRLDVRHRGEHVEISERGVVLARMPWISQDHFQGVVAGGITITARAAGSRIWMVPSEGCTEHEPILLERE